MARARFRVRTVMLLVMLLAVLLATAGRWVVTGCPIGYQCGSCIAFLKGRKIVASSDHLLGNISLETRSDSATLFVEGRQIAVRSDEAVIDGTTSVKIPAACKEIEFTVSRGILEVWADGMPLEQPVR